MYCRVREVRYRASDWVWGGERVRVRVSSRIRIRIRTRVKD